MKSFNIHCSGCWGEQSKVLAPTELPGNTSGNPRIRRVIVYGDSAVKKMKQRNALEMKVEG